MFQSDQTMESLLTGLPEPLLRWYRLHARDLPWRHTSDPYRIWVSEIMLQQTRVAAVLGYYRRFLEAFPCVETLAAAPEERLFKLWEGLGYYSRARNLHRTARIVAERGAFPRTSAELQTLPGIGEYTAAAVASAAYGERISAVDGNVLRVVSRLTDCHDDVSLPATKRMIQTRLTEAMPRSTAKIRLFNQSTMELGALVCVPNGPPKCGECPTADRCLGRARGTAESLPRKAPKLPRQIRELTVYLLLRDDGRIALRRRPDTGLLAGLWEFPNVPGTLDEDAAAEPLQAWGLTPREWLKRLTARHIFTHVEWHMTGCVLRVTGSGPENFLWTDSPQLLAIPSAFQKYRAEALRLLGQAVL
jgi:A/G-specific adenine glycosylase